IRDAMKSRKKLDIFDYERPVGIQIFGGDEEAMALSAKIVETVNPDLVDINFGCPVKKVVCKGAGAGVLKDIDLMVRLTKAVVNSTHLPVTVKTRLGWDTETINIMEVAERLQEAGIKALTIHARTRSQMYKGEADWDYISKVKNNPNIEIPIFGNGDVDSPEKALEYRTKYDCDGIMIGRGAIGYPWIFEEIKHFFATGEKLPEPTISQRLEAVRQHAEWSAEWKGERLGLIEMRQHYSNYFRGIPHFKEWRMKFLEIFTLEEMDQVIAEADEFYRNFQFAN
ncbi:MAG TPA: tRNA dihydrouridine synthase DusB, partial [Chryseobacterium sp.]|nr:tRNA dihydrouridine synthase DusB [Chryseobacterium sp.]